MEGYEDGVPDAEQEDMWEEWFHDCAIDEIAEYYQLHPEEGVIVYKNDNIPESGEEGGYNDDRTDENDVQVMNY